MAAKEKQPSDGMLVGLAFIILYVANYMALQFWQFPFVYCWMDPLATAVYVPFANIINLMALAYLFFKLVKRDVFGVLDAFIIVNIVFGLPMIAKIIFGGGSCS